MRFVASLLAALVTATTSQLVVASNATYRSSRVAVHIPFSLHDPNGEEHVQAEFGFTQSIGSISQYVFYTNSFLCDPLVNHTEGFPSGGFKRTFIMMADRGSQEADPCSFVTKARHAQQAGAAALVIADTRCPCSDQACLNEQDTDECEASTPALVNDGSGADVSIPSFLLYKNTADKIKKELKSDQSVLMELAWGLQRDYDSSGSKAEDENSLAHVWYHLWTTAHDPVMDIDTYANMRTVAVALQEQAHFSPRFSLIQGSQFQCTEQKDTDGPCDHLCTNHGRYCAIHARELSGHAIVTETLRRLCIWKHYGEVVKDSDDNWNYDKVDPVVWWDYVIYHRENCYGPHEYADEDCLAKAFKHAKVKKDLIDQCMADSGGLDDDNTNSLLENMITEQDRSGVVALPALQVHRQVLDHTSSYGLFESICRHFWTTNSASVPAMCETCGACPNVIGCLEKGKCVPFSKNEHEHKSSGSGSGDKKKSKGGHGWTVFWLLSIAAMGGGGYYYYKQQEEQNGREGGILNHYMQLGSEN